MVGTTNVNISQRSTPANLFKILEDMLPPKDGEPWQLPEYTPFQAPTPEQTEQLEIFKKSRADILAARQALILGAITPAKVLGSSLKDLAVSYEKLNNAERLERGKSTTNVELLVQVIQET